MEYKSFASGYLVVEGKVLLVHHNKFNKWVPAGGHINPDETPAEAAAREFEEETGIAVDVISAYPIVFTGDSNSTPIPLPFHIDIETEGFSSPRIGYFFFVKPTKQHYELIFQESELYGINWYSKEDLQTLQTFDQVRALATYAIDNYPKL